VNSLFDLSAVLGWVILIAALALAAYMLGMPRVWIGIGALLLLGVAIVASARHSKPKA